MKTAKLAAAALLALAPAALSAQTAAPAAAPAAPSNDAAADVVPGATVYDMNGGTVGRIVSVEGDAVVLDTGTNRATLSKSGFGKGANGPVIGMTKAQLDQAMAQCWVLIAPLTEQLPRRAFTHNDEIPVVLAGHDHRGCGKKLGQPLLFREPADEERHMGRLREAERRSGQGGRIVNPGDVDAIGNHRQAVGAQAPRLLGKPGNTSRHADRTRRQPRRDAVEPQMPALLPLGHSETADDPGCSRKRGC